MLVPSTIFYKVLYLTTIGLAAALWFPNMSNHLVAHFIYKLFGGPKLIELNKEYDSTLNCYDKISLQSNKRLNKKMNPNDIVEKRRKGLNHNFGYYAKHKKNY